MDRPRLRVDFNEMLEGNLVLLAKEDAKADSTGVKVHLHEGLRVHIYDEDEDDMGQPDNLIADGVVEPCQAGGWASSAKWCCRIDERGIRHMSDDTR